MRMNRKRMFLSALLAAVLCFCLASAGADTISGNKSLKAILNYINEKHPTELTLEGVRLKPTELVQVKNALPAGAAFHFTTNWGVIFSDDVVDLDLRPRKGGILASDLEAIIQVCPNVKSIDHSNHSSNTNKDIIPLIEKYPDIQFEWRVDLGKGHHVSTHATAYSTMNHINSGKQLTEKNLEVLKYCPRLKALDLGHNYIENLDFLQYLPDLELLIIADNRVKDLTPVGSLKHLKYAELFKNPFSDISPLANCTELIDLNLTATNVTDISPLNGITTLERLWINMLRKLPKENVDQFAALHPNCEVDFKASHAATVDGWRDHPRYKHFIWCFKHYRWIPFDEPLPSK